jgi:hypothetical protein
MAGTHILARMIVTHLRLRFLLALVVLVLAGCALTAGFLWKWHQRGDSYAIALGSLLGFFAALITAMVTLTYLHVSRRSLAAAEAAIQLQREQWEARITVKPRFWLGKQPVNGTEAQGRTVTFRKDLAEAYRKGSGRHYYETIRWPPMVLDVWNDGERSMRIASYRLWVRDEDHLQVARPLAGFVVPPNELKTIHVTEDLVALAFRQRGFSERYERPPCEESIIGVRLYYSDWHHDDRSSRDEYYLLFCAGSTNEVHVEKMDRHA